MKMQFMRNCVLLNYYYYYRYCYMRHLHVAKRRRKTKTFHLVETEKCFAYNIHFFGVERDGDGSHKSKY